MDEQQQPKQGNDITKEQLSDAYTSGSSDGIMMTEDGLIQIKQTKKPNDPTAAKPRDQRSSSN